MDGLAFRSWPLFLAVVATILQSVQSDIVVVSCCKFDCTPSSCSTSLQKKRTEGIQTYTFRTTMLHYRIYRWILSPFRSSGYPWLCSISSSCLDELHVPWSETERSVSERFQAWLIQGVHVHGIVFRLKIHPRLVVPSLKQRSGIQVVCVLLERSMEYFNF